MNRIEFKRVLVSAMVLLAFTGVSAQAADAPAETPPNGEAVLSTLITLIRTLVDQGVLSAAKAADMLREAGVDPSVLAAAPPAPPVPPPPVVAVAAPVVRVPYVPQLLQDQLREDLKEEVLAKAKAEHWAEPGALPPWLYRLTWYGDVRARMEREDYGSGNSSPQAIDDYYQLPLGTTLTTTESRNRPRLRARLGVDAAIDENFSANVMVVTTTGDDATASPVSFNADEGRYGRPFSAGIEVAYLQWSPNTAVHVTGGRLSNPYLSSGQPFLSSDLIWWRDLAFDGLFASFTPRLGSGWSAFLNGGAHPLQSQQLGPYNTAPQQWLFAGQTGTAFKALDDSVFRLDASYFSYVGIQGDLNPANPPLNTLNADSAPLFRQRGNTMFDINWYSNPSTAAYAYAGQFKELEFDANFELAHFEPLRLGLDLDYVRNVGFHASEIASHIGAAITALPLDDSGKNGVERPRVTGFQAGVMAGRHDVRRAGDWQVFGGYRYLERDAVVDAFTSPDYHLGGTDQRGPFMGFRVGMGTNTSMILRYSATHAIDAVPTFEINQWFLDFLGSF